MSYSNNNPSGEARQLLQFASNLNVLNMSKEDFQVIGNGLVRTLQYEMKVAQDTNDRARYDYANNTLNELNNMDTNNINPEMVSIMVKELIRMLSTQLQGTVNNSGGMFNSNRGGNQQNNIAFGGGGFTNNTQQSNAFGNNQRSPSFGSNGFGGGNQAAQPQVGNIGSFRNITKTETEVKQQQTVAPTAARKLTLSEVKDMYTPISGSEYMPLYDENVYKLEYELYGDEFGYILVEL